jgi:hypothetical protein
MGPFVLVLGDRVDTKRPILSFVNIFVNNYRATYQLSTNVTVFMFLGAELDPILTFKFTFIAPVYVDGMGKFRKLISLIRVWPRSDFLTN